jgi:hypothetical protein
MNKSVLLRGSAIVFGAALLASAGAAAFAAEEEIGTNDVDVNVAIEDLGVPGALALTVDASSTTLTESGSTALERSFAGALPKVTVTDTRDAADVPADSQWYVLGSASDFVDASSRKTIAASHLGWSPNLVEGAGAGESYVEVGGDVLPSAPGLIDQELLFLADSAQSNAGGGVFSATAGLKLVVPADVAAGSYTSKITLSLFE